MNIEYILYVDRNYSGGVEMLDDLDARRRAKIPSAQHAYVAACYLLLVGLGALTHTQYGEHEQR